MTAAVVAPAGDDELAMVRDTAAGIARRCRQAGGSDHSACWTAIRESGLHELRSDAGGGAPVAGSDVVATVVEQLARSVCGAPLLPHVLASELQRSAGVAATDGPLAVVLDRTWSAPGTDGPAWGAVDGGTAIGLDGPTAMTLTVGAALDTADPSRELRRVSGAVPADAAMPVEQNGVVALARILLSADLLGAAGGILDQAVEYAKTREQFGVPVGSFQAVQHLLADAHVSLTAARSALLFAVRAFDAGDTPTTRAALVAKSYANEAGLDATQAAVQAFGGIAITVEHPAHRHLRRVLVDREVFGTSDALNDLLLDEVSL